MTEIIGIGLQPYENTVIKLQPKCVCQSVCVFMKSFNKENWSSNFDIVVRGMVTGTCRASREKDTAVISTGDKATGAAPATPGLLPTFFIEGHAGSCVVISQYT